MIIYANFMKSTTQLLVLVFSLFALQSCHKKKHHPSQANYPKEPGYVSFNLAESTLKNKNEHSITLFGCNIALTKDSADWHGQQTFQWNTSNQVLSKVPFGKRRDTANNKEYFISKYYIASPPVFGEKDGKTLYDIGLVIPDQFTFDGIKPVQKIYLDYSVLKPSFIKYIPIKFDASIGTSQIEYIPFKVECNDFPWYDTDRIKNGMGASGIGSLTQEGHSNRLFLPYYDEGKNEEVLNCEVTILNDILLYYEIKFVLKNGAKDSLVDQINLKTYYENHGLDSLQLKAIRRPKDSIPCGCQKPKASAGPYGE
jgi:hypothetical protein